MPNPLQANVLAIVLALTVVTPVAAQGPKGAEIPGLGKASDAPEGLYVPEGMNPAFRTFIAGYAGFLAKVASREAGFRNTLQEIVSGSGQSLPPPVSNWDEAADRLFGAFDLAYGQYKQVIIPAASNASPGTLVAASAPEPVPTSGDSAAGIGNVDTGALAVGVTGLLALIGAGGLGIAEYTSKLLVT